MSRHLGLLSLLLLLALLLAAGLRQDPGYVLVSWGRTSIEMSLMLAALFWLGSLWLMVRLLTLERWLLRVWRADWARFLGLGGRRARKTAQEITENRRSGAGQA